ncbi:MAG: glycoside hydrolase family 3 C-terminal domain-containing protein [Kiritimatiellae bacterium]|nr:glycoside hydrolase family 3 C-terminal domain-containing protein [Kiritimatiellia bacterium]
MKRIVLASICAATGVAGAAMLDDDAAINVARETLAKMTLEEKVSLCGGSGTMTLPAIPRVGINSEWTMSDNSATVRPQMNRWDWGYTKPKSQNTMLPCLSALAATWNTELAYAHGDVLGAEMRDRGVDQLLGPGVNIMRTPLNGRNWEYLSEDPVLAAKMCVPMIKGVQSHNVSTTVKHFCLNNQELERNSVDTICDDRTLNEIYLPAFKAAVKEGGSLSLMTAYNKVNGFWCSENVYLQKAILRDRWGFKGIIVTDWGGQHSCVPGALAGGDVEMNRGDGIVHYVNPKKGTYPLAEAVKEGKVPLGTVDEMAFHVLYVMAKTGFLTGADRGKGSRNTKEHQDVARRIGEESVMLLKNDAGVLPLDPAKTRTVLVIGGNADSKQCSKGCSAEGNSPYEITPFAGIKERLGADAKVTLMPLQVATKAAATDTKAAEIAGGHVQQDKDSGAVSEAGALRAAAEAADAVVLFTGTELGYKENMESESRDRVSMNLPPGHDEAIRDILKWNIKKLVVVSRSGTPVGYTWTDEAKTFVQISYLGQEAGHALAAVLFGDVNPSGKLPCTWPKRYEDTAVSQMGTYGKKSVIYKERFYVGYRWHDFKKIEPMFPFGHGLSYTTFGYELSVPKRSLSAADDSVSVSVKVSNSGRVDGKEIVQLYVSALNPKVERCVKDLKGFAKVAVPAGKSADVELAVTPRDLAYYDVLSHRFRADKGEYEILVGASSADIRGKAVVTLESDLVFED